MIVLLGGFNPTIFTPEWFARYEIATETEKNDSTVSIIHPEISNFKLGSKLIQVDLTRFSVESTEAPWVGLSPDPVAVLFTSDPEMNVSIYPNFIYRRVD